MKYFEPATQNTFCDSQICDFINSENLRLFFAQIYDFYLGILPPLPSSSGYDFFFLLARIRRRWIYCAPSKKKLVWSPARYHLQYLELALQGDSVHNTHTIVWSTYVLT